MKIRLVALLANCTAPNEMSKKLFKKYRKKFESVYKRLIVDNIVKNINGRLSAWGQAYYMTRVGKLVQKNGIKQMINPDLGVIQALFDFKLNTFFARAFLP